MGGKDEKKEKARKRGNEQVLYITSMLLTT